MAVNLKGRSFLTLMDFTPEEIRYMLDLAHDLLGGFRAAQHIGKAGGVFLDLGVILDAGRDEPLCGTECSRAELRENARHDRALCNSTGQRLAGRFIRGAGKAIHAVVCGFQRGRGCPELRFCLC